MYLLYLSFLQLNRLLALMKKQETIAKQLEDERDEPMAPVSNRQLLEEERSRA